MSHLATPEGLTPGEPLQSDEAALQAVRSPDPIAFSRPWSGRFAARQIIDLTHLSFLCEELIHAQASC